MNPGDKNSKMQYEIEGKLSKLQNNIQVVERNIRNAESEKRSISEEANVKMKRNDLEIQQLRMEVKELEVKLGSCLTNDEKIIRNEFRKYSRDMANFKGKSAKESIEMLESEILDLQRKNKNLDHELELNRRALSYAHQQYKDMTSNCDEYFGNEPTEYRSVELIRQLENEQQKMNLNITECEIAESRLKRLKGLLGKNRLSYPELLYELEKEHILIQDSVQEKDEELAELAEGKEEEALPLSAGGGDCGIFSNEEPLERKVKFSSDKTQADDKYSEIETELLKMKENLKKIKESVLVSEIQEVEHRFLEQKVTQDDLEDLKKRLTKSLQELKTEKKQLESKMELMKGATTGCPKRELEEDLRLAKLHHEEQESRKTSAQAEVEKIEQLLKDVKERLMKMLKIVWKKLPDWDMVGRVSAFALIALVVFQAVSASLDAEWEKYKSTFGKQYKSREEGVRRKIWEDHVNDIQKHNLEYDLGLRSFRKGINKYADMDHEEFVKVMNGYKNVNLKKSAHAFNIQDDTALPKTVDWRTKGIVTPIKDQAQCGSCWAFSATGSLEGQHSLATGKLVSLSEQNLVDCSGAEGNMGCEGGLMDSAFEYIEKNGGIDTESSYPYTAQDGTCHFNKKNIGARVTGYVDIHTGDEKALQQAVATVGPISVAIDASQFSFQLYQGGIYDEPSCSSTQLDHGVLAVGYGTEDGSDYWLVKNSWGTTWGIKGYIKMSRNKNNQCGIATQASYPTVQ